jgi:hypothetical protein
MLDGDDRTDTQADNDWHQSMRHLFRSYPSGPAAGAPSLVTSSVTTSSAIRALTSSSSSPAPFDIESFYSTSDLPTCIFPSVPTHLNSKTICRILATRETIFKYGIYLPRSDRDADSSPESARWKSGRQLEWLRLKAIQAFEYDWNLERLALEYPDYKVTDIGRLFYIYDYKFSGEHRVRLVFDGSRQSPSTYDVTYSPTVRAESIRIFHVYAVEMGWEIRQFDVPQAFLQSAIDHTIFVYPPRTHIDRPGQILKLRLALYGAKQSSALFFKLLNDSLLTLGFVSSTTDPCFYRRDDALIIVHVDDMRVAANPNTLTTLHFALFERFKITTSDGTRFLGMDVDYNMEHGILKMSMKTYLQSTMDRFTAFDVSRGCPYREIVGCLLWAVLCVVGPELFAVKQLARRCNDPTPLDYQAALKLLRRLWKRREVAIIYKRGSAGPELVPSQSRPTPSGTTPADHSPTFDAPDTYPQILSLMGVMDVPRSDFLPDTPWASDAYTIADDDADIPEVPLPVNLLAYTDASFAVTENMESISGYVAFLNGTPISWGSLRQTTVADSTCASEFVAASVCCKYLVEIENRIRFLGFTCPKPYRLYTDSQSSLSIATNAYKMGKIRHIAIRYHFVRCMVSDRNVDFIFCVTEDMIADLFTKMVRGATFDRLSARFYYIGTCFL